jgi:hypothetical protein
MDKEEKRFAIRKLIHIIGKVILLPLFIFLIFEIGVK